MKIHEIIDMLVRRGGSNYDVTFLFGERELEVVQIESELGHQHLIVSLCEVRDLSDPEKHEG